MEFIEHSADVSGDNAKVNDNFSYENEEDKDFIDDSTQTERQPSDYLGLRNIKRETSCTEDDIFSQSDVEDFLDPDVETKNCADLGYVPDENDLKVDKLDHFKNRIQKFNDELFIPLEKDDVNSFFI